MKKIDVCIPAYHPGEELEKTFIRLSKQTVKINRIIICNTDVTGWSDDLTEIAKDRGLDLFVYHIGKEKFDHGRVRDEMMKISDADLVLFMTQDAYPADDRLIEKLAGAFDSAKDVTVAAAYGRQLAKPGSDILERYSRNYNYPKRSCIKTKADLDTLGIKTFFCSNVCAMYRRDIYLGGAGFPERTIFNEDMINARGLIDRGYGIAYVSDAMVFHSHSYTLKKQFKRNFDLAYSQAMYPQVFGDVRSESEGMKYVRIMLGTLTKRFHFLSCIKFCFQCVAKYAGFFLGKRADILPKCIVKICTDSPAFFD